MLHSDPTGNRTAQTFFLLILVSLSFTSFSQTFTVDSMMRNGRRDNRINFVYLADGYQAGELGTFITDAGTINDALFNTTPFKEYKNFFNAFAIRVPSVESGAKHPGTASDEPFPAQAIINPNNYFQSTFDYFNIHRLLVPQNSLAITTVLANNLPDYDHGLVVVNSPYYGGSGGTFPTASTNISSAEVAIHEIGHSFAGLGDEYWAGTIYAAEYPNMTANSDPATIKWKAWLGINNIGIYPYGAVPPLNAWFRPHQNCKMQYLGQPFCSVCTEQLVDVIHQQVNMIDGFAPAATSLTLTNTNPVSFTVSSVGATPNTVSAKWYINNVLFANDVESIDVPVSAFNPGTNAVRVDVVDSTALSKLYLPGAGYVSSTTWDVVKPVGLPVALKRFTGTVTSNHTASLNWAVANAGELKGFELEKSKDGVGFSRLAAVPGERGKDSYSFTDESLYLPYTHYRLKIINLDGTAIYSDIIRLQNPFDKYFYKVYQNAEAHRYHLKIGLQNRATVSVRVADVSGKLVMKKDFGNVETNLDYNIDLAGKPAGIYFLNISINKTNYTVQLLAR
jgi:hypothetical protein